MLEKSLIRQPFVLVPFLFDDLEPTLVIRSQCLHFSSTPLPNKLKIVVMSIFQPDTSKSLGSFEMEASAIVVAPWSANLVFVCC